MASNLEIFVICGPNRVQKFLPVFNRNKIIYEVLWEKSEAT